jgi:hypothetical protein
MHIQIEIASKNRCLLGLSYNQGELPVNDEMKLFHEFGIGFLFFGIFITVF